MSRISSSPSPNQAESGLVSITFEIFCHFVACLLKKSLTEKTRIYLTITAGFQSRAAKCSQLLKFCELMVTAYLHTGINNGSADSQQITSWQLQLDRQALHQFSRFLLTDLLINSLQQDKSLLSSFNTSNNQEVDSSLFSIEEIEQWLVRTPLMTRIADKLFAACFLDLSKINPQQSIQTIEENNPAVAEDDDNDIENDKLRDTLIPLCILHDNKPSQLLTYSTILMLNDNLQAQLRSQWKLLFSSLQHGESFTTLCSRIINKGPSLLIVRDKKGHVFGGFASQSWNYKSQFFGNNYFTI